MESLSDWQLLFCTLVVTLAFAVYLAPPGVFEAFHRSFNAAAEMASALALRLKRLEAIRAAAERFRLEGLAEPIVFGASDVPAATEAHVALVQARREKMSDVMAARLLKKPLYRAGAMVPAAGARGRRGADRAPGAAHRGVSRAAGAGHQQASVALR